ncbi:polyphosphate polymerase domain-containing protein [Neiella marina]|uniref:Polyphosphate polymerase domain-containing protein n=1 Tax=Neiella holothuriorum TaxID=2870530 RepID=A0ABS7EDX8_9GAMM|nr:polyphosphate polymerase domain-containing protein [Neiella holothuriorum]MBW8189892.1 polyphosphate polymerase domain-containing protein [Neiella holothuriorum]
MATVIDLKGEYTMHINHGIRGQVMGSTLTPDIEQAIADNLALFDSHGLADLNKANLQDRVDSKFVLPLALLPQLLVHCRNHYSALEINGNRTSSYYNQYFDTAQMRFYQDHHNGKLNRYKVRQRTYLDTNTQFLEVKFKNNQRRTIKSRVACGDNWQSQFDCESFIQRQLGTNYSNLQLAQVGGYRRIALANEAIPERLTLDFELWYQAAENSERIELPGFFIAELKQSKRSKLSPFYQLMSALNYSPISFSKYCIGCALTHPTQVKYNRFKPTLMKLNQLTGRLPFSESRSY